MSLINVVKSHFVPNSTNKIEHTVQFDFADNWHCALTVKENTTPQQIAEQLISLANVLNKHAYKDMIFPDTLLNFKIQNAHEKSQDFDAREYQDTAENYIKGWQGIERLPELWYSMTTEQKLQHIAKFKSEVMGESLEWSIA